MFDELAAGDGVFGIMPCQKKRDLCWRVWNAERQKYDVTSYSEELKNSQAYPFTFGRKLDTLKTSCCIITDMSLYLACVAFQAIAHFKNKHVVVKKKIDIMPDVTLDELLTMVPDDTHEDARLSMVFDVLRQ